MVLAVLAILIGFHEYLRHQHNVRVNRSLKLYERYQTREVLAARLAIDQAWNTSTMWDALEKLHDADGNFDIEATKDLALSLVSDRKLVDSVFVVQNLVREASVCLIQHQCDQYTVCKLFWGDALKLHYFFRPYVEARNHAWDEADQDVERYYWQKLDNICNHGGIILFFEQKSFCRESQRYLLETFNLHYREKPNQKPLCA